MNATNQKFTLLRIGQTRLLLPRTDVRLLELAFDVNWTQAPPRGVGWMTLAGRKPSPVYCCADTLEWQPVARQDTPVCVVLTTEGHDFALLCSEVVLVNQDTLFSCEIPPVMHNTVSPLFHQLATNGKEVFCVTSAQRLWSHISA
ncbi:MAG: hypothetical protein RIR79_1095 [Pseudomonadota bacterium]|jgi:hypothetical protein